MAVEKNSALTSRGTVMDVEMNALSNNTYTAASPEYDNTANLDSWGVFELLAKAFGVAPAINSPIHVYGVSALDGTNYEQGSASLRPADSAYLGTFQMFNNTSDQRIQCRPFKLKPVKMKFIIYNLTGQAMAATLNVLKMFTFNRTVN